MKRLTVVLAAVLATAALAPLSAHAKTPPDFYGVVNQGEIYPYDAWVEGLAGVETMRTQFDWRRIQPGPGRCQASANLGICNWTYYDYFVGIHAYFGIRIFPYILNVPSWVAPDPETPPIRSKKDKAAWTDFVQALVARYGPGGQYWKRYFRKQFSGGKPRPITHWEIWNEPSDGSYWEPQPDPEEYAKLLEITGRAIHKAHKRADVVFAGLFGTPTEDNDGIKAFNFYRRAFARKGLGKHFDDVGVHPYGPILKRLNVQMDWVLEEMKAAGFAGRDIWVTELAWSSSEPPTILGVGPEGQARMLKRGFRLFEKMQKQWNIAGVHWYAWQDLDPNIVICEFCEKAGLLTFDRQAKPSLQAFLDIAG